VSDCPFCEILAFRAPAEHRFIWPDAIAITPLNPVTGDHTLIIPRQHVTDFADDPDVTALTARRAAEFAGEMGGPMNLITSWGEEATQSVFHLHIHLVPRYRDDGLALPWYSGKSRRTKERADGADPALGRDAP
jgi:histidine triad (HIT) family protein